jgi:hypothetical protein
MTGEKNAIAEALASLIDTSAAADMTMTVAAAEPEKDDELRHSIGPIEISIAWGPILQLGAEALAKAMGTKLGEALGTVFADLLIGKRDADNLAAFQAEVVKRLERIEGKLDEVLKYLHETLPNVFKDVLNDGDRRALNSSIVGLTAILAGCNGKPKAQEIPTLELAAKETGQIGYKLLQAGQGYYLAGVHALSSLIVAYSRMATVDKTKLRGLGIWANAFADIIAPWIDARPNASPLATSFPKLSTQFRDEKAWSDTIVRTLPTSMLYAIVQPIGVRDSSPVAFGYWGSVSVNNGVVSNSLSLAGDVRVTAVVPEPVDYQKYAQSIRLPLMPWWTPVTIRFGTRALPPWDIAEQVRVNAQTAVNYSRTHDAMIRECELAKVSIQQLYESCMHLAQLRST